MPDPTDKFLVVDGRYIQRSTIAEILPDGSVLLLDGRIIESRENPK